MSPFQLSLLLPTLPPPSLPPSSPPFPTTSVCQSINFTFLWSPSINHFQWLCLFLIYAPGSLPSLTLSPSQSHCLYIWLPHLCLSLSPTHTSTHPTLHLSPSFAHISFYLSKVYSKTGLVKSTSVCCSSSCRAQ